MFAKCVKYTPLLIMEAYYCMVTTGWHEGEKSEAGTIKAASFEGDGTTRERERSFSYVILSGTTGDKGVSIDRVSRYTE